MRTRATTVIATATAAAAAAPREAKTLTPLQKATRAAGRTAGGGRSDTTARPERPSTSSG